MTTRIYEALADAFASEGTDTVFCLTGDGNMHWEAAITDRHGVRSIHVRHEHTALAMATAWARTTGRPGIASVTCGPGLTQTMTALATAAQARIPLVVFAGEDPMQNSWYNQRIEQAPLVTATGAAYIAARHPNRIVDCTQEAFLVARQERRPVVLAVPLDLQKKNAEGPDYVPSTALMPKARPVLPHPDEIAMMLDRIGAARRILVLAGLGAIESGAREACIELAERVDGGLMTTLPARGFFTGHPRDLGLSGGYLHASARDTMQATDLVIAVGASLSRFTSDQGKVFKPVQVIQVDPAPSLPKHGQVPAACHVLADGRLTLEAVNAELAKGQTRTAQPGWGIEDTSRRVHSEDPDPFGDRATDALDPRDVVRALSDRSDPTWAHVSGSGHCAYYGAHLYGRSARDFLTIREFGAIGNGLSYAIGRCVATPDQPVMLTEGDGGLMMHIQELETVKRCGLKLLICALNDGAYGSEVHKLRVDGVSDKGAIYGRGDLARVARGFGLEGHTVTEIDQIPTLAEAFAANPVPTLWDIRISDQVMSPAMRKIVGKT
ncbi:thiamine pyrophosphate-binding protein [Rhodobacterales bacterium HKCCE2091]|nr:thiamine pyrophosphate-binding protein [Rhodobacterales bacterium HKCCE2091]